MYSVEDLLISHGYKLPKHNASSSAQTPAPVSLSHRPTLSSPTPYSKHNEVLENMPGTKTVNGYDRGPRVPVGNLGGTRQPQAYGGVCANNNNEPRDRSHSRREGEGRGQMDTNSLGESLTSDSGFCDGSRGPQSQFKNVSHWRRRGQDFTVLLDYADYREPHGGEQGRYGRPGDPQQARGQELSAEELQRAAQERHRWAAHVQAQGQAQLRCREREAALRQWRMVTDRKCQSLGTDEWRPAVSFSRQLSHGEDERWAQGQQRLHARTPEGMVVHPRTKAKSQSLPRMLQPENLHYVDIASSGQELYRRVNGYPLSHHSLYKAPCWLENGRPASANQLSMTPKTRFTRPPRPPSYEMHQQIRGSCEVLSGRDSVLSQARDRTPLPTPRTGDHQLDYFTQDSGPPGYIPPPSYKRAPIMGVGCRGFGELTVDYRGDLYQQIQVSPDGSHWFTRPPAGSWPDPRRDRSMSGQKQLYPVYTTQEHPGGGIQYIPFDDPRIRHISSALGGNSLTDADKIRHIRHELPSVTVSEPVYDDSAFLPPPLGPFITSKMADDANQTSSSGFDNDNNRWQRDLHKVMVDNFPAIDQNCNNRYSKNQRPPASPFSAFQAPLAGSRSHQGPSSDQVYETITQVKKIAPDSGPDNNRNTKRRVSETIFCLVSVPVHTPTNINKDLADQNNNETIPSLTVTNTETFAVGLKESLNVRSKSVNEMPIKPQYSHFHTNSMRNYKRAPLRKEIIDAWALQASEDKELCYAGSWPGNQYRNQETQTGSPLTMVKDPEPHSNPGAQEPFESVSEKTSEGVEMADISSSYGYPMVGQKDLHLSSNSAFSRLSLSPTQPLPSSQQYPSSPSKDAHRGEQQPSPSKQGTSCPPESAAQVTFGQFLLKPASRRPCDAIGELESINKEMEDTISKRPKASQSTNDLHGRNKKLDQFKPGAHFVAGPEPGREAISLPPMHIEEPNNRAFGSKLLESTSDRDGMDITVSGPQADNILSTKELSLPSMPELRDIGLLPSPTPHIESNGHYRQDIPVPQESLLRDVGLTVYTENPGGPREPAQLSLSVPSLLDHEELGQSVQPLWESRPAPIKNSSEHNSNKEHQAEVETRRKTESDNVPRSGILSISRTRSESSRSPQKEALPNRTRLTREVSFVFGNDDGDERYASSEPLSYKNESTVADKHLEKLLSQEKANSLPAEDLSNLYEVKSAKGIPENESIEQRAARILGIAIPVEALGVPDKPLEDNKNNGCTDEERLPSKGGEKQQVIRECEQDEEEPVTVQGAGEPADAGSGLEEEEGDRQKHNSNHSDNADVVTEIQSQVVLDLPEFPPIKLSLSLPVATDEKLSLSMCGAKRGRGGACKLTESPQDKLNLSASSFATSPGGSTTDRAARLEDSVSPVRCLGLEGPESEETDGGRKREVQEETVDVVEQKQEEHDATHETNDMLGDPEDICKPTEEMYEICEDELRQQEQVKETNVEIAHEATNEGVKEVDDVAKSEETEQDLKLEMVADDEDKLLEKVRDVKNAEESSRAEATPCVKGGKLPKPKQRTRLQKPPLLPKPRSVPKREITLSFSSGKNMEDDEILSVSDSYDPSRVERV